MTKTTKPASAKTKKTAPKKAAPAKAKTKSKSEQLIDLLSRDGGATAPDLIKHFGVLPHTLRGMISTLRKKQGLEITSERVGDVTTYKVKKG